MFKMEMMLHLRLLLPIFFLSRACVDAVTPESAILPACQAADFHFEYTECDSAGGRWRVAVPKSPGRCTGGNPPPPNRGKGCEFTCEAGQYINIQEDQNCHACPAGTYSLGGGVRFEDWDHIPSGFSVETEEFSAGKFSKARAYYLHQHPDEQKNCSGSPWTPKGKYMASVPGSCASTLVFSANLVKAGYVKFDYQYTENVFFQFLVQNDQCQTVGDRNTKWPQQTDKGEWATVQVSLKSGLNLLHWKTIGMPYDSDGGRHNPVLIKRIEVHGVAYSSECTRCMNGTYSEDGAEFCSECAENTYSSRGDATCAACDPATSYSERGSAFCSAKKPCTVDNYFEISAGCENNQTHYQYQWLSPKICSDTLEGAVSLPPATNPEPCPPCNPGMSYVSGACQFCPQNKYSTGSGPCSECGVSTAPEYALHLKWWKNIPTKANITTSCLSMNERGCTSRNGWITDSGAIYSGRGHADDAYLVLTLKLGGFRGTEQVVNGEQARIAQISFYFELECSADCTFFFMQSPLGEGPSNMAIIETWSRRQVKQLYQYDITTTGAVEFNWAFQKRGWDETGIDYSETYDLINDFAKIFEIVETNTLEGGAARCRSCPQGTGTKGCIPCPAGHYISVNTSSCTPCPANTVVRGDDQWGIGACIPCGEGLKRTPDKLSCYTDCKYTNPAGQDYDFTALSKPREVQAANMFTASGTAYYHNFNFSLCANPTIPAAICKDNISYGLADHSNLTDTETVQLMDELTESVESMICRTTLIPPSGTDDELMAAQPVSLGDILVNITADPSSPFHESQANKMAENGYPGEDTDADVHFLYLSQTPTSACKKGRSSVVTLRCDMAQANEGVIDLPPRCPDGTCDGCEFHFLWRTPRACPLCKKQDYTEVKGECVDGEQIIHYYPPKHCVLISGNNPYTKSQQCTVLPFWIEVGIASILGLGVILLLCVLYCWKKNRKLEYKYSKLMTPTHGGDDDAELPPPETCALDDDEDDSGDEQFDSVGFSENKSKKFFNKIKSMGKKDDNPFESIALNDKQNLM